jgi:hypothetical protein
MIKRSDVRDFIEHAIGRAAVFAAIAYLFWVVSLPKRSMFIFAPIGIAYFIGLVIVGKMIWRNRQKRVRKGKRYKFLDIDHQSGWITFFAYVAMIAGGSALFWLWASGNLVHQWWLAIPAAIVTLAGGIFSPDKEYSVAEGAGS